MKFPLRLFVLVFILLWGGAAAALAESFPSKPIRVVVCFPAGGLHDTIARLIGTQLSTRLGQPVVVDIVAGAGGTIGATSVARAKTRRPYPAGRLDQQYRHGTGAIQEPAVRSGFGLSSRLPHRRRDEHPGRQYGIPGPFLR